MIQVSSIQGSFMGNVQLRSTRIQLQDGKLAVQGKLFFFVLYRAEDEARRHSAGTGNSI